MGMNTQEECSRNIELDEVFQSFEPHERHLLEHRLHWRVQVARHFRLVCSFCRLAISTEILHLRMKAMRLERGLLHLVGAEQKQRRRSWHVPPLKKQFEKPDGNLHDPWDHEEHDKQDCENCNGPVFVAGVHENPNVKYTPG